MTRLPASALLAAYLHYLPSIAGLVSAAVIYGLEPDLWPGRWAWVIIGLLLAARLIHPLYSWLTTTWSSTADQLRLRTGLVVRTSRTIGWHSVVVLDIEAPWSHRLLRLGIVSLRVGGDDDTVLTLNGLPDATIRAWSAAVQAHRGPVAGVDADAGADVGADAGPLVPDAGPGPDEQTAVAPEPGSGAGEALGPAAGRLVYRASSGELLVASLAYGQFVVLGTTAAAAMMDLVDQAGLLDQTLTMVASGPLLAVALVVVALGLGFLMTLVRFHGFEVYAGRDLITIRYGLIERHEREIRASTVVGVRAHRNAVEMLADRVRVSLITADSTAQLGTNLVLPSLPRPTVTAIVHALFPGQAPIDLLAASGRRSFPRAAVVLLAVAAIPVPVVLAVRDRGFPLAVSLAAGLLVVALLLLAGRLITARLALRDASAVWTVRHLVETELIVSARSVHLVTAFGPGEHGVRLVRAHYWAARSRALTAVTARPAVSSALGASISRTSLPLARERRERASAAS
ncbi:PH domain-containing protein [Tersicoccus sp. Bi-70]|uniref:PH domain-containing protein n=1 Tax=Tersicoccus sp. Bi-70 TaxID=1897634 RepID=UPI000977DC6F|nr:PH domain-containing protein [Tersicoccus sp. Bi-70]OMH32261.1 hypothetical protein BGP79_07290 [Tersicoccus sp. Bi-70]